MTVQVANVASPQIIFVTRDAEEQSLLFTVADALTRLGYDTVFGDGLDEISEREVRRRSSVEVLDVRGQKQYLDQEGEPAPMDVVYSAGGDTLSHAGCEYDYRSVIPWNYELITKRGLDHVDELFRELCRNIDVLAGWFLGQREVPIFPDEFLNDPEISLC